MSNFCYLNGNLQRLPTCTTSHNEDVASSSLDATNSSPHSTSFWYNLSILKDKVHQVESFASLLISPGPGHQQSESTAIAIANMGTLIQEIIFTSSSMMFSFSKMSLGSGSNPCSSNHIHPPATTDHGKTTEKGFYSNTDLDWFGDHTSYNNCNNPNVDHNNPSSWNAEASTHLRSNILTDIPTKDFHQKIESPQGFSHNPTMDFHQKIESPQGFISDNPTKGFHPKTESSPQGFSPRHYDIIEMEVADLLAKYTHYCQVCGKGFKRDANMRMHMRAHGDEYKSKEALSKNISSIINEEISKPRKYSCPAEGCRWNKKHAKFQPLKSMICMKNHYKRSHCPKMYVCKRCNMKNFSVLSDLRTHEKHCGDVKWQCSCGNTFSRKDKLMGHVALFVGHTPNINSLARMGKRDSNAEDR